MAYFDTKQGHQLFYRVSGTEQETAPAYFFTGGP